MNDRSPGAGRYAHIEREQRWLLGGVPAGLDSELVTEIADRYIAHTRLRLRRAEARDGTVVFKLGQKVRADPADPEVVKLTNIYLSEDEYDVFAALPAAELRKTRRRMAWDGRQVAIDEFHGRLHRLVLAECELEAGEPYLSVPPFALSDVTSDDRYSGGALARASAADVERLITTR